MASLIERASTGRAKCRACSLPIARGEERFGEALANAYGEGESLFWFHLACAACCRPDSVLPFLAESVAAPDELSRLQRLAEAGIAAPRLSRIARAERATSGRARCRHCRELIAHGTFRIALHGFEEGRFTSLGTIHASCAAHYLGALPEPSRFSLPNNELDEAELAAVLEVVREGAARSIPKGLVKAAADEPEREAERKSS